jgi:hypothetical protein
MISFNVVLLCGLVVVSLTQWPTPVECGEQTQQTATAYDVPTAANLRVGAQEARGPSRYSFVINLVVPLNGTMSLTTVNQSKAIYWALIRYTNDSAQTEERKSTVQIYNLANPLVRNNKIKETFECVPNDTDCYRIVVRKFNVSLVGVYSYQSFKDINNLNTVDTLNVDYNISTFIRPLSVDCAPVQTCLFNETTGVLSVVHSTSVTFTCTSYIAQNDIFEPSVELKIRDDYEECGGGDETQYRRIPASSMLGNTTSSGTSDNTNVILYKLTRKCTRSFSKSNRNFKCELVPKMQRVPMELQPTDAFDSAKLRLDVQYPAEYTATSTHRFNHTIIVNTSVVAAFSCPFDGNPSPQYEWRVASVANKTADEKRRRLDPTQFLSSSKEYTIPKDLDVGVYAFECRAKTLGLVDQYSDVVKFYLDVRGKRRLLLI